MNVPVILRERRSSGDAPKQALTVTVDLSNDTVADVLEKVSLSCKISSNRLSIILGGCRLNPEMTVKQLQLGPSTSLLALVAETKDQSVRLMADTVSTSENSSRSKFTAFFVYCKNCKEVRAAKLRVHCSTCDSTSVQVRREPERWSDVLRSERIPAECFECFRELDGDTVWARFVFKCTECSEPSAALQHVRLPCAAALTAVESQESVTASTSSSASTITSSIVCCICLSNLDEETSTPILDLRCGHLLCLMCFTDLVKSGLKTSQFTLHPVYGYTIGCPWPTCKALINDPHHFALAGHEIYSEYKSLAVEAFVAEDAVKCPHCDIAFIWDSPEQEEIAASSNDDERRQIQCPHCEKQFCAVCRREPCTCEDEEAANRVLFEATTRACPRCSAKTERTGGCAHMKCWECGNNWCFVCVAPWTEECQWDHWFA